MPPQYQRLRTRPDAPTLAAHDSVVDPYYTCGGHPDIVARLWEELGSALPVDCRRLVYGRPALVRPDTGDVLAICLGTRYGLFVPGPPPDGATLCAGPLWDVLGDGWVFGGWGAEEVDWLRRAWEREPR